MVKSNKQYKNVKIIHLDKQLIECSKNGDLMRVKALLSLGADIHAGLDQALYESAIHGNSVVVKHLLKNLADTNINPHTFIDTVKKGHLNILKQMLTAGYHFKENKDELLLIAVRAGHIGIVKCFLDLGSDIHYKDNLPLTVSAEAGNLVIVQYLLQRGASIENSHLFELDSVTKEVKNLIAEWMIAQEEAKKLSEGFSLDENDYNDFSNTSFVNEANFLETISFN